MNKQQTQYLQNKSAKCNTIIKCPICGKTFGKKQYSQAFCSTKCKDKYHNWYDDKKRKEKTKNFIKTKTHTSIIYYDRLGRAHSRDFYNPTLTDMLDYKLYCEWHDDDWCED